MAVKPKKKAPTLQQKPFFSKPFLIFISLALSCIVIIPFYIHHKRLTADENAQGILASQGIQLTPENFLSEILLTETKPDHIDNLHYFIALGFHADAQDANGNNAVIAAAQSGNIDTLALILSALPADAASTINHQNKDGNTALMEAVKKNNMPAVNKLIASGAELTLSNLTQETAFIMSIKTQKPSLMDALLSADITQHKKAVTINMADNTGISPLMYSVQQKDESLVKQLLPAGADIQQADVSGFTPLMTAVQTGNLSMIQVLLAAGAKTDVADSAGNTPLLLAIRGHMPEIVKALLKAGANVDYHTTGALPIEVAIEDSSFDYPLLAYMMSLSKQAGSIVSEFIFKAVDGHHFDVVKAMIENGTSPNSVNSKGETLLYHTIESGDEPTALLLIDKGADILQTGVTGLTPLEAAIVHNQTQVAKKIISLNVSPNQKTREGYSVAEMAIYKGNPEILEALLDKNAHVEKDFGLLWSIRDGGGKAAPILLAHGAQPNVMTDRGEPALWLAAAAGENEAVAALVKSRAGLEYPNKSQKMTPLAIAAHNGQLSTVKLLVEAGAHIDSIDGYGMTPLAHAVYMSKSDVASYLLSKGANIKAMDAQGRSILELAELANASVEKDKTIQILHEAK